MAMDAHLDDPQISPERRGGERRALRLAAETATGGGEPVNAVILNLSESGLLLETEAPLAPGEPLDVVLPEAGTCPATVIWAGHGLAGCKFDRPLGRAALSAAVLRSEPPESDVPPGGESFGQRLRRLREARGLHMVKLAQLVGVSRPTMWSWESDRSRPQPRFLAALAEALRVPEAELQAGRDAAAPARVPHAGSDPRLARAIERHRAAIAELLRVSPEQVEITVRF